MAKVQEAVPLAVVTQQPQFSPELGCGAEPPLGQGLVDQPRIVQGVWTRSVRVRPGKLGLRFSGTTVTAVNRDSPLLGVVDRGAVLLSVNGVAATTESSNCGRNAAEQILLADDGASPRTLVFETKAPGYKVPRFPLPREIDVSVPPGPIGVRFRKTTVSKILKNSPLEGKVRSGVVLLAVNGVPVTTASLNASPDILETSEDGGKMRTLTFGERPVPVDVSGLYRCHCDLSENCRIYGRAAILGGDGLICGVCISPVPPFVIVPPYFCFIRDNCNRYRDWEKVEEDYYACENQWMQIADRHTGTLKESCGCVCTPVPFEST